MKRRRFLTLSAAFACAPGLAQASTWRGHALGAEVSVTLHGPSALTGPALAEIPVSLEKIEALFSLYRPSSALSLLNARGWLHMKPAFQELVRYCDDAHRLSNTLFDPTIQPLWQADAQGLDLGPARALVGWDRVTMTGNRLRLAPGQMLTFNGIAQGFATDMIRAGLAKRGANQALINIGEFAALGGPWRLAVSDPAHGPVVTRTLDGTAIATSSPGAMQLASGSHILSPDGRPALWSTISIEDHSATRADALSTAAVFMSRGQLDTLKRAAKLIRITSVDHAGDIVTF
ncbi:FAD:protein FMN transferase [Primorskyibacter marinus]|uniref:FAD:protein FMN transferase n=1 Tax=Primorskyibacter marinus TaxID=1977320 RepID=UPI000E308083|nr:FAD:protein FMN transferase [Primorskyibacter marinus]